MKVVLLTTDDPMYMPRYLQPVMEAHANSISEVIFAPNPNDDFLTTLKERYRMLGPVPFLRFGFKYGTGLVWGTLPARIDVSLTGRYHSVQNLAEAYGVPTRTETNLNGPETIARIRKLEPDLLLSIACEQLLGEEILSVPSMGAINLHGSLLPKYRGLATAFWVLYHEEDRSGVTAHYMNEEFDDGDILLQREFEIAPNDSMHDVYHKIVETGSSLAVDLIERFESGDPPSRAPNPPEGGQYRSLPGDEERREFKRRNNRFI